MKITHTIAGKGILHDDWTFEVPGKKEDEPAKFYNLLELLEAFQGKVMTISVKEEQAVETAEE